MKTPFIHADQVLLGITKMIIDNVNSFKWNNLALSLKFSPAKLGYYLLPLVKQLFRDNFMGSDLEMGMLLIFIKGYLVSAGDALSNNALTALFRKLSKRKAAVVGLESEKKYTYQQAA